MNDYVKTLYIDGTVLYTELTFIAGCLAYNGFGG